MHGTSCSCGTLSDCQTPCKILLWHILARYWKPSFWRQIPASPLQLHQICHAKWHVTATGHLTFFKLCQCRKWKPHHQKCSKYCVCQAPGKVAFHSLRNLTKYCACRVKLLNDILTYSHVVLRLPCQLCISFVTSRLRFARNMQHHASDTDLSQVLWVVRNRLTGGE